MTLWVRETCYYDAEIIDVDTGRPMVAYRADDEMPPYMKGERWRSSIHMPRWASRITLDVAGVRVERVADISEEDAVAEGFERREHFARYWDDLHGPVAFARDAWVWVIEFQRRDGLTVERVP